MNTRPTARLDRDFFVRDTLDVARDLLGRTLCRAVPGVSTVLRGRIVEVEAYDGPEDRASHAHRGLTPRTRPMFAEGGIAYVYLIYGMHHCFNVVTGPAGYPAAILVRACETPAGGASASGPGRLTRAFRIDRRLDGASLLGEELWLEAGAPVPDGVVRRTPRIGVDYSGAWSRRLFRFLVAGHPDVSGTARRGRAPRAPTRDDERSPE